MHFFQKLIMKGLIILKDDFFWIENKLILIRYRYTLLRILAKYFRD